LDSSAVVRNESPTSRCLDFDRLDIVALTMLEGFGPVTAREHLERIWREKRPFDDGLPRRELAAARANAKRQLTAAGRVGARCVIDGDADFPEGFRDLQSIPLHFWVMGDASVLTNRGAVAIVGTRQFTSYGERVTRSLANAFSRNGITVVSGMARGIDSVAHLAAMEAGGRTVAVLGTGVDVAYPAAHRPLHRRIVANGAVISESPPGAKAIEGCFPKRNRLIAALGQATVVVEAGVKSGALGTADWAEGINRKVGVVPGPIDSPASLGGNLRLRDGGAQMIATIEDALTLIGISEPGKATITLASVTEEVIWKALDRPAANFDVLTARTGLPARLCLETVTALELRGIVDCTITGEVRRR
jgi:DNA processing protein